MFLEAVAEKHRNTESEVHPNLEFIYDHDLQGKTTSPTGVSGHSINQKSPSCSVEGTSSFPQEVTRYSTHSNPTQKRI